LTRSLSAAGDSSNDHAVDWPPSARVASPPSQRAASIHHHMPASASRPSARATARWAVASGTCAFPIWPNSKRAPIVEQLSRLFGAHAQIGEGADDARRDRGRFRCHVQLQVGVGQLPFGDRRLVRHLERCIERLGQLDAG
jgi:hypothetical protein